MVVHPATQDIGFAVRRRVACFLSTLRHSGFHVGLAESCDAFWDPLTPISRGRQRQSPR